MEKQKHLLTNTLTTPFVYYNKAENLSAKVSKLFEASIAAMQNNKAQQVIENLQGALKESPDELPVINNFGAYAASLGYTQDGARLLEDGVKKFPMSAELRYNLGTLMFMNNAAKQAQDELLQAQSIQSTSAPILNNLALTYLHSGNFIRSRELLETALSLHPTFDTAHHNLGHTFYAQHEYDEAIKCFTAAYEKNPNNVMSLNDLACCYYCKGDTADALACLKDAIRLQPEQRAPYFNLGFITYHEKLC